MPDISIRVAAQDEASAALGAVGTSALTLGTNFETADVKISGVVQRMRDGASLAATEWATFSTAYATGWTDRTTAATSADGVLIALEAAQKIRGTTVVNEETANTLLRVKNYTDIGIAAANLDYMDGVRNGNAYVRLGQLAGWWTAARDTILGVIDRDLVPGMDRFAGGLSGLVVASQTTATGVSNAFIAMANSVIAEVARAQAARDAFAQAAPILPVPVPGGGGSVSFGGGVVGGGGAAAAAATGGMGGGGASGGGGSISLGATGATGSAGAAGPAGAMGLSGGSSDAAAAGAAARARADVSSGATFGGPMSRRRAGGGPVIGGQSYMVGEEGPEIFVPSASGSIVPNDALGGWTAASGGGAVNVHTLNIYGVQDVGVMFSAVMREARSRGIRIGV